MRIIALFRDDPKRMVEVAKDLLEAAGNKLDQQGEIVAIESYQIRENMVGAERSHKEMLVELKRQHQDEMTSFSQQLSVAEARAKELDDKACTLGTVIDLL